MKKLRLYGAAEEQTQLIRELQLLGCVEIGEPQQLTDTDGEAVFHAADSGQTDELVRTAARLTSALETLKNEGKPCGFPFAAVGTIFLSGSCRRHGGQRPIPAVYTFR